MAGCPVAKAQSRPGAFPGRQSLRPQSTFPRVSSGKAREMLRHLQLRARVVPRSCESETRSHADRHTQCQQIAARGIAAVRPQIVFPGAFSGRHPSELSLAINARATDSLGFLRFAPVYTARTNGGGINGGSSDNHREIKAARRTKIPKLSSNEPVSMPVRVEAQKRRKRRNIGCPLLVFPG